MPALPITTIDARKAVIRRILTYNPTIGIPALKERLESNENPDKRIVIGKEQLYDLVEQIRRDRVEAVEKETKEEMYAQVVDLVQDINNLLRSIAQEERLVYTDRDLKGEPTASPKMRIFAQNNRIKALNSIVENTLKMLNLRMDLGLTDRKLGTAELRVMDMVAALKKIRNGDYTTALPDLITDAAETKDAAGEGQGVSTTTD